MQLGFNQVDGSAPCRTHDGRREDLPVQCDRDRRTVQLRYPEHRDRIRLAEHLRRRQRRQLRRGRRGGRRRTGQDLRIRRKPGCQGLETDRRALSARRRCLPHQLPGGLRRRGRAGWRSLGRELGWSGHPGVRPIDRESKHRRTRRRSYRHPGNLQPRDRFQRKLLCRRRKRPDSEIRQRRTASRHSRPVQRERSERDRGRSHQQPPVRPLRIRRKGVRTQRGAGDDLRPGRRVVSRPLGGSGDHRRRSTTITCTWPTAWAPARARSMSSLPSHHSRFQMSPPKEPMSASTARPCMGWSAPTLAHAGSEVVTCAFKWGISANELTNTAPCDQALPDQCGHRSHGDARRPDHRQHLLLPATATNSGNGILSTGTIHSFKPAGPPAIVDASVSEVHSDGAPALRNGRSAGRARQPTKSNTGPPKHTAPAFPARRLSCPTASESDLRVQGHRSPGRDPLPLPNHGDQPQ